MDKGAELYRSYLSGNDEAFAELVKMYADNLILFINGLVHNLTVSEDLMEDSFAVLVVKKPSFEGKTSFKTFLFSVARNKALSYRRQHHKLRVVPAESVAELQATKTLEDGLWDSERKNNLYVGLNKLKEKYRTVLYLVYFEEMSYDETAIAMGITVKQVDNYLYRAKIKLKEIFQKEGFDFED